MFDMEKLDDFINYCGDMNIAQEADTEIIGVALESEFDNFEKRFNNFNQMWEQAEKEQEDFRKKFDTERAEAEKRIREGRRNMDAFNAQFEKESEEFDKEFKRAETATKVMLGITTAITALFVAYVIKVNLCTKEEKELLKRLRTEVKDVTKKADKLISEGSKSGDYDKCISACKSVIEVTEKAASTMREMGRDTKDRKVTFADGTNGEYSSKTYKFRIGFLLHKTETCLVKYKNILKNYEHLKASKPSSAKESFFDIITNGDIAMEKLTSAERKALPDSAFGLPKLRKYPLLVKNDQGELDWTHLRNAIAYFATCKDEDQRKELAKNIAKVIKKHNVDVNISENNIIRNYAKFPEAKKKEEN